MNRPLTGGEASGLRPCKHATTGQPVCAQCARDRDCARRGRKPYQPYIAGANYGVIPLSWPAPRYMSDEQRLGSKP